MGQARQTALERLHKQSISAKDISTQFWCEKQMELFCTRKYSTPQMMKGTAIHNTLQQEVFVPLAVEPSTYTDRLFKFAYENNATISTLLSKGMSRELHLYGSVHGYSVTGQIDELKMEGNSIVVIENKTTNSGKGLNSASVLTHTVQVMLYRKLLDDLRRKSYTYDNFNFSYKLGSKQLSPDFAKGLMTLGLKGEYASLEGIFRKMFSEIQALPEISTNMEIHYFDRETGALANTMRIKYDEGKLESQLTYAMKYWSGERDALPVTAEEKWKCEKCKFFGNECKVWWNS